MNMIFPFTGERRDKHYLTRFTVSFDGWTVCLCIFCLKTLPQHRILLSRKFVFSAICMHNCCLSSENALKRGRISCIQSSFFFFSQFRHFDYSFAQMFMSCWTAVSCVELHGYLHTFHTDHMPDFLYLVIYLRGCRGILLKDFIISNLLYHLI